MTKHKCPNHNKCCAYVMKHRVIKSVANEFANKRAMHKQYIISVVTELLIHLYRNYSTVITDADSKRNEKVNSMRSILQYLQENWDKRISVSDIAKIAGLSQYHFCRIFKETTGYTIVSYVTLLKCMNALRLLHSGEYTIKEVSTLCGFDNPSYFTKMFKKNLGFLPSECITKYFSIYQNFSNPCE